MAFFDIKFSDKQFDKLCALLERIAVSTEKTPAAIDEHRLSTTAGFGKVGQAIADISIPELPPGQAVKGKLMSRYKFNADQAPVTFDINLTDVKDSHGNPASLEGIELIAYSESEQLTAEVSNQHVSEDGLTLTGTITLTGEEMTHNELAVVTYIAKNQDTGEQIAADTDEFETGPGEATIGQLSTPVPLTPVEEAAPAPVVTEPAPANTETGSAETGSGTSEGDGTSQG